MITDNIELAKQVLMQDDIIGMPTETVYGLAANAYHVDALKKIFQLKDRPFHNPLIVHIKSIADLNSVAKDIPKVALELARSFWPGPLTLILPKQPKIPPVVTAGKNTVAVRIPNHPLALALLNTLQFPLAAPSANPFGSTSPTTAKHVEDYFGERLQLILDGGRCTNGLESTIIGFEKGEVVLFRHGAIPIEEIERITGPIKVNVHEEQEPNAPGMMARHYAPKTQTYLTEDIEHFIGQFRGKKMGLLMREKPYQDESICFQEVLSETGNLEEAAHNLYAALHKLDGLGLDVIIAERFPNTGLGTTINDRLNRAAKSS